MNVEKWTNDYINNINLKNIEWIKLNSTQLYDFLEKNYLDRELWEYVLDKDANSLYPTLLGMRYLNFNSHINGEKYNFLLGIVDNNIGKKTIVSSIIYMDQYFVFIDQKEPLTYISTIEVNSFFRNQGLFKKNCEVLFDFISTDQHILISQQSEMGKKCNVYETLKKTAIKKGFEKSILENNYHMYNSDLYELICSKPKILKKTNERKEVTI